MHGSLLLPLHSNNHLIPDKICLVGVRAGTGTEHAQYVHQKQEIQLKNKKDKNDECIIIHST